MTFDLNTLRGSSIALSILVILVPWSLWSLSTARQHQKKVLGSYPPYAPGRLPIVGHLPYLAQNITVQELFRRWSLEAGPIFTVQLGTKRWVILNSMEAINALIVGRSTIYSSRNISETLVNIVFNGVDHGGGFAFFPYGRQWRNLRRVAHGILIPKKIDGYQPILNERRCMMLQNIWDALAQQDKQDAGSCTNEQGIHLTPMIEHFTLTSILAIAFGNMCSFSFGDPRLQEVFSLTERSAALLGPSEQLREFFPILRFILPSTKQKFIDVRNKGQAFYGDLLKEFKERQQQKQQQGGGDESNDECCFVKEILANGDLSDRQIVDFMVLLIGAGSDTTASTVEWMVALLANHPDIQEKVYDEIKEHVGLDRLPAPEDESRLVYLQCVILETLRLCPPAPLSVPHATSEDDIYHNWLIPANTTVIMNLHAIHHDPTLYPEPHRFVPERHLHYVGKQHQQNRTAGFSQTTKDRPHLSFSTGRRVCVGIHLAERNLFLAASGLLSCFKFERENDALINVSEPRDIRSPAFAPPAYRVKIVPRHERVQALFSAAA